MRPASVSTPRVLVAHTNTGASMARWHELRAQSARALSYDVSVFAMAPHHPYVTFPRLDRLWRRRERGLMTLYERLGAAIDACDIFVHFNGALIHPEFLQQFRKFTVYHCADDPDASDVLSRPVAASYDLCAIANAACVDLYRSWGCRNVIFWPLGASIAPLQRADELVDGQPFSERDVPLMFLGSKLGVPSVRFIGKYLGLYRKKRFMQRIERAFPDLVAYGAGWSRGWIDTEKVPDLFQRARVGLNVHNTLGPINFRMYDLAAYGVCQVCDNKRTLGLVFDEGREIVGFESTEECVDRIRHFLANPDEASAIGAAAQARFRRDYTMTAIWSRLFAEVGRLRSA